MYDGYPVVVDLVVELVEVVDAELVPRKVYNDIEVKVRKKCLIVRTS